MNLTQYKISEIRGVCFDSIISFTLDHEIATVKYQYSGKERIVSVETEAIRFERNV